MSQVHLPSCARLDGLPVAEVHSAAHVLVLRRADPQRYVPHHVPKIWGTSEPGVDAEGQLVEREGWLAREWLGPKQGREGRERVYAYTPADRERPPQWSVAAEAALSECPVVWIRNEPVDERHDGEGDFEGSESTIDELNVILCATSTGTALNADPTLVVKCDPKLNPGRTKKGAYNTIYSPGGAESLELSGQAVRAGIENVERLRAYLFEQTGMAILDPEKLSGAAQSGEALKRLMAPTLAKADRRRETYGAGIVQVLNGLWRLAKRIEASPPVVATRLDAAGAPVLDAAGAPVTELRKPSLRLPARHVKEHGARPGRARDARLASDHRLAGAPARGRGVAAASRAGAAVRARAPRRRVVAAATVRGVGRSVRHADDRRARARAAARRGGAAVDRAADRRGRGDDRAAGGGETRRYWAERIVRTELMASYNLGAQGAIEEEVEEFPDLKRIILAHHDRRTAQDSLFVHGEIRGVREMFVDGVGRRYLVPPARPNDREVVVPWRERRRVPRALRPRS